MLRCIGLARIITRFELSKVGSVAASDNVCEGALTFVHSGLTRAVSVGLGVRLLDEPTEINCANQKGNRSKVDGVSYLQNWLRPARELVLRFRPVSE